MTPTPDNAPVKPSALPLVALILGIIGFCFPPLFLVAFILAIVSIAKSNEPAFAARKTFAIVTLVLGLIYVPVVGILAAIAIPSFIRFQARSKQSECKMNLKAAYRAQEAFYVEHARWGETAEEIDFRPEPRNRYLYRIGPESALAATFPGAPSSAELERGFPPALQGAIGVDEKLLTMACAGNIDNDATIDVWSVATQERTIDGERVPAGIPYNDVNDVRD